MSTLTRKSLRQSLQLKACPRCGGDVCRMRDTFGVYHRCAQCGREIRATMPAATAGRMPAREANDAGIASVATIANTAAATAPAEANVANMTVPATATAATIATPAGIVAPAPSHPATDRIGKLLL